MIRIVYGLLFASILVLAGCAGNDKNPYIGMSAYRIYATGHKKMQDGYYNDAVDAFTSLDSQYPFGDESKLGDIDLIYSYYMLDQPALGIATADRYIKLFPLAKQTAYAYYMLGVMSFDNGRGVLQRRLPYDMSKHDPANYFISYRNFYQLLSYYPNSPYAKDARRRMIFLKNVLANHELEVAQYYYKMQAYVASASRAADILNHFPRTTSVKPALELLSKSYQQLRLEGLKDSIDKIYALNYDSKAVKTPGIPVKASSSTG